MLLLAVVAETLAVVGEQDDQGVVVEAARAEGIEQAAHDLVGVGDLAVVGLVASEPCGRRIRRVRFVQVEEQKEARVGARARVEPALGRLHRVGAVALHLNARPIGRSRRQAVVIGIEAAREADLPAEHVGRDHGGRPVAERSQQIRQQGLLRADRETQVVAHAVLDRQQAGEHRDVGGQRLRRVRVGALEEHRVRDEPVDGRRLHPRVPIGGQPIGPQGVDGDEHDRSGDPQRGLAREPDQRRRHQGRRHQGPERQPRPCPETPARAVLDDLVRRPRAPRR